MQTLAQDCAAVMLEAVPAAMRVIRRMTDSVNRRVRALIWGMGRLPFPMHDYASVPGIIAWHRRLVQRICEKGASLSVRARPGRRAHARGGTPRRIGISA